MKKDVRLILEENIGSTPLEGVTDVGTISINNVIGGVLEEAVTAVAKIAPMALFSMPSYWSCNPSSAGGDVFYIAKPDAVSSSTRYSAWEASHSYAVGDKVYYSDNVGSCSFICITANNDSEFTISKWSPIEDRHAPYLRMLSVENSTWLRPIVELTPLAHPYVSIARSDINLSVGNEEKPLAVDSFYYTSGSSNAPIPIIELYPAALEDTAKLTYIEQVKIRAVSGADFINCDANIYQAAVFYAAYLVASMKGYANAEAYKAEAMASLQMPITNNNINATAGAEVQA